MLCSSRSRERGKGISRFDSRNARYASADINERRGKRNFRAFQNVNRKRTYPTENSRVSRSAPAPSLPLPLPAPLPLQFPFPLPFSLAFLLAGSGNGPAIREIDRVPVNTARLASLDLPAQWLLSPRLLSRQTRPTRIASSRFVKHLYGTIKATSFQ